MASEPNMTNRRPAAPTAPPVGSALVSPEDHLRGRGALLPDRITFAEVFTSLREHFILIAAIALATLGATALLVTRETSFYRATAVLKIGDARQALTSGLESPEIEHERQTSLLLSQVQLLRSRGLIGAVVDSAGLRLVPARYDVSATFVTDVRIDPDTDVDTLTFLFSNDSVTARSGAAEAKARYGDPIALAGAHLTVTSKPDAERSVWIILSREQAIDRVLEQLRVTPRPQTNVVDISFTARRPAVAQRVVNTIAHLSQSRSAEAAQQKSRRRRVFLESQLQQTDSILAAAQLALSDFRRTAQVYSSRDKLEAHQTALMTLDMRWQELEAERQMYAALLAKLERGDGDIGERLPAVIASPGLAANPMIMQLSRQLVDYQTDRDSLTTGAWRTSIDHPDVQRLDELIASTTAKIILTVRSHVETLSARVAALQDLRHRSAVSIERLPQVEAEEARLAQEVETIRKMADELREEHQRARMAEAVEVGRLEIIDLAALPYKPVPRLRFLKLALGLVAGLALGYIAAVLRDAMNTSIRRREDVERLLKLPGLAVIPPISPQSTVTTPAVMVEAYRTLRTNILFAPGGQALRTLVITSATPGEGKTLTAVNLACSFAREGRRVLLVDCDGNRAKLHRMFSVPRAPGLKEVLLDQIPVSAAIRNTGARGLSLLTAGARTNDGADPLKADRLRWLLDEPGREFDLVILDTPPVLALADGVLAGALADGVLLVVRAGETQREAISQATRRLIGVGANLIGVVLNDPTGAMRGEIEYNSYGDSPRMPREAKADKPDVGSPSHSSSAVVPAGPFRLRRPPETVVRPARPSLL